MNLVKKIVAGLTVLTTIATASPVFGLTAEELLAQIQQLQQQLNQLMQQYQQLTGQAAGVPAACQGITFNRDLKVGMSGNDVKCLQALLNQDPETRVAETGPGSPGNETTYFGQRTKAAVIKFQEKYRDEILTPAGLTAGTGYVGPKTRAKLNAILSGGEVVTPPPTPPAAAGLTVSLAADTPAAGVVLGKQVRAPFIKLVFTNGDNAAGKVTKIEVKRLGIASDLVLDAIYLLDENGNRIGDEQTFSNGVAVFEDSAGLFTVGAGQSVKITVAGDVASSMAGYTVGVGVTNVVGTFTALNATFPINGNIMSVASNLATELRVDSDSDPGTQVTDKRPGDTDVIVWKGIISPTAKVTLSTLTLKAIGNIEPADLQNFKFYLAGSQIGEAVNMGSDYYVRLNLAANPVTVTSGNKELKVTADIVGGTAREVYFDLVPTGVVATDVEYGVNVPVVQSALSGMANLGWSKYVIGSGRATLQLTSDSPVSVGTTSEALIAKYVLRVFGERGRFTSFTATNTGGTLSEVKIYVDGVQKAATSSVGTSATQIQATAFYVDAGSSVTIEVKANTTNYTASSITFELSISGTGVKSSQSISASAPAATLAVTPAQFSFAFAGEPADFLALAGTEVRAARYKFNAKASEAMIKEIKFTAANTATNVSGLKFNIGGTDYVGEYDGSKWVVKNINYTVSAETTVYGDVFLSLRPVALSNTDGNDVRVTLTDITYVQANVETSSTGVNRAANHVYVYKALPKITALTTGSANDLNKGAPTWVTLYKWKIEAVGGEINATFTTTTLQVLKAGTTATTTITGFKVYKDGVDITNNLATINDITTANTTNTTVVIAPSSTPYILTVPAGGSITLEVKAYVEAQASGWVRVYLLGDATSTLTGANFIWHDGIEYATGYLVEGLPAQGTEPYQHTAPAS